MSSDNIAQDFLSPFKRLISQDVVSIGDVKLLESDLVLHPVMPLLSIHLLHGATLLNLIALLLGHLVRQVHPLFVLHHDSLTEFLTLFLPLLEALLSLRLLISDLLLFMLLSLLQLLLELQLFLPSLLLLLLGELRYFVGHLVPLLELAGSSLDLKCQHYKIIKVRFDLTRGNRTYLVNKMQHQLDVVRHFGTSTEVTKSS